MKISIHNLMLSVGFTAMIAVTAHLAIPMEPVPLTMQTAVIFAAALLLPMGYALFSVLFYIFLGGLGVPVFSGGRSGLEALTGPTAGFIVGFMVISVMISYFTRNIRYKTRGMAYVRTVLNIVWPLAIATVTLQALGILWGKYYTGSPWPTMFDQWLHPFYLNMIFKIAISVVVTVPLWNRFSREQ